MATPKVVIFSGYGLNCEEETRFAFGFEQQGAHTDIIHLNDLIDRHYQLADYQIAALPGGFSFGDHTGSGKAYADRIRHHLMDELFGFVADDHLIIGICNGFQILTHLGLLPAIGGAYGKSQVALLHNDNARYLCRWVDVQFEGNSPWTKDIGTISLPIAHGEGKFYAPPDMMAEIRRKRLIAGRYVNGEVCQYQDLPANPNGSLEDVAAITDETGMVLGMMPHPERAINFTHLPHWTYLQELHRRRGEDAPRQGPGIKIFENAVSYFR